MDSAFQPSSKQHQEHLINSEFFFKFFEHSHALLAVTTISGKFIHLNPQWVHYLGWQVNDLQGKEIFSYLHPDDRLFVRTQLGKLTQSGNFDKIEFRFLNQQGHYAWLGCSASYDKLEPQNENLVYIIGRDITDLREAKLHTINSLVDFTTKNISDFELHQIMAALNNVAIISTTDFDGKILEVNQNFCHISGYSEEELIGQNHRIINSNTHSKEFFRELWQVINSGKIWRGEIRNKAKNGNYYWVQSVITPIYDEHQKIVKFLAVRFDITAEKVAQEKIIAAEKMSTLGQMASGVAHEINNPLFIIDGHITKMLRSLTAEMMDTATLTSNLQKLQKNVRRIEKIIKGLKLFSRHADEDPFLSENLEEIINDCLELCREKLKSQNILLKIAPSNNVTIECRATQIAQVLINLMTNACDAIQTLPEKWIELSVKDMGPYVVITVRDSGCGISQDLTLKIMQPFFTTKEFGQGTGLGLSISKGIVEAHQGHLYVNPNDEHTAFVIELPKVQIKV